MGAKALAVAGLLCMSCLDVEKHVMCVSCLGVEQHCMWLGCCIYPV